MSLFQPSPDIRAMQNLRDCDNVRRAVLYPATLLSQYEHSPRLSALVRNMESTIDPEPELEAFRKQALDPLTAEGWGLDQWGKIVDIGRVIALRGDDAGFGFIGSGLQPFGQGTFYSPEQVSTGTYRLSDQAYLDLILLKASANVSDCSVPSLNRLLFRLYGQRGCAYVLEIGVMRIRYVFEFPLRQWERALLSREDVPPRPAGVGYEVLEVCPTQTFGFAGAHMQPFNQGTFTLGGPTDAYSV